MDAPLVPFPRHIRGSLEAALADTPVVCLLGPRQCGKTTLAQTIGAHREYISLDEAVYATNAESDPLGLLTFTSQPKTIDEVQRAPGLLQTIKTLVDRERQPGQFLLTGSANLLLMPQLGDSLAGRVEYVYLHPLTDAEKERSLGNFLRSLISGDLVAGSPVRSPTAENSRAAGPSSSISGEISREPERSIRGVREQRKRSETKPEAEIGGPPLRRVSGSSGRADRDPPTLQERLVAGGYPEPLTRLPQRARQWHRQYINTIVERDVRDIARVRDVSQLRQLLELLTLQTGELLNVSALSNAVGVRRETVEHYLAILERLFLVRRLHAWHKNDAKRLVKAPKVHLVDSGLACTLCGLTSADWVQQRTRFGHVLESYVVQQVIAQAGWTDPDLRCWHYRDKDQVEVDLVLTRGKETWGIEVKAAATVEPKDATGILRLAEQCGKEFRGGIVLYSGTTLVPLSNPKLLGVPLRMLWQL